MEERGKAIANTHGLGDDVDEEVAAAQSGGIGLAYSASEESADPDDSLKRKPAQKKENNFGC